MANETSRYDALIEKVFFDHYRKDDTEFEFDRQEFEPAANELGIRLPRNLGDIIYTFRSRRDLPDSIMSTQPEGMEWLMMLSSWLC